MRIIAIFFLIVGLYGCKAAPEHEQTSISLSVEEGGVSKTDVLSQGDAVGVFAAIEGTENYFLENAKYIVGSDGRTLTYGSTVYYPDRKEAVAFTAYLPFGGTWSGVVGTFAVPTDQSTALALKQADLCWAAASSTPVAAAVPLEFTHKLARLLITTNTPTTKIAIPNAFSGGTLDIKTGVFTNTLRSEVFTTGTELIVPAQPLTRLLLTVAGVEHPFTPTLPLDLPAGQTTTLNLTLNSITKTATLASTTTTAWGAASKSDAASRTVNNQFTVYWLVADSRFSQINKIGLTVKDETSGATKEYPVSQVALVGGSTMASASYTFALANVPELHYPYTVSALKFYKDATLVHTASVGNVVARTGGATLGSGQNIALTLSADKASVAATVTSSTFALTSNVPYGSSYTTGGASAQGSGLEPPYANRSIVFTYPAQGLVAAAVRTHVMTIAPTVDYTGSPNKRTFTVTQAAVPTSLTLSAAAPGEVVPAAGKSYTINVTSNTAWKSQSAVNGVITVPASGTGSVSNVQVIVPYTVESASALTRTVSVDFITTAALSGVSETTVKWSGLQHLRKVNPPSSSDYVTVGTLRWAKGNLVALAQHQAKVGKPEDHGLYFQFGSLIGYKGGALANGGSGVGANPYTGSGTQWWGGKTSYSWANDMMVCPSELVGTKSSWTNTTGDNITTLSDYYFNYSVSPWETASKDIRTFNVSISGDKGSGTLADGRYAKQGVGDPCSYYLGGNWRLPLTTDIVALCNGQSGSGWIAWSAVGGSWTTSPTQGGNFQSNQLFFPASGNRSNSNGSFYDVTTDGYCWSSSVDDAMHGYNLLFTQASGVIPQNYGSRSSGFPVRCVSSVP